MTAKPGERARSRRPGRETVLQARNRLLGPLMHTIVVPTMNAGGAPREVLALLSEVVSGVMGAVLAGRPLCPDGAVDIVLDRFVADVRTRLAENSLRYRPVAGNA